MSRWLRAAALLASESSSNDAGITCTEMPLARAAFVAAASTPLALPVRMEAFAGSELTYSETRAGSEKCLLPTMATLNYPAAEALLPIMWMFSSNIAFSFLACLSYASGSDQVDLGSRTSRGTSGTWSGICKPKMGSR